MAYLICFLDGEPTVVDKRLVGRLTSLECCLTWKQWCFLCDLRAGDISRYSKSSATRYSNQLCAIGMIDDSGHLTPSGLSMAKYGDVQ